VLRIKRAPQLTGLLSSIDARVMLRRVKRLSKEMQVRKSLK
jgi:hypothetical protein